MRDTDELIETLAQDAKPVTPLAPPLMRAGLLLAGLLAAMGALVAFGGHVEETIAHLSRAPFALELIGALAAGVGAVVAAVMLSIPGRARAWLNLPVPGLVLWLAGGGLECYRQVEELGYVPTSMFASQDCFVFIMAAGLPSAAAAYVFLRRHLSIDAVRVMALAGLGAALLAAVLLQLVHAHGTNPVDFGTHVVAVTLLMLFAMAVGRFDFRRP